MTKPDADPPAAPSDWAIVTRPTEDAAGARILRVQGDSVHAGEVRALVSGVPLAEGAEVVRMKPIATNGVTPGPIFEVESMYKRAPAGDGPAAKKKGPAQVASREYRSNWDTVFARKDQGAPN